VNYILASSPSKIWACTQGEGRPLNELRRDMLCGRFIPNCWTVLR